MDDRTDIESLARTMADRLRDMRDAEIMDSGWVEELAWHEATALQIADHLAALHKIVPQIEKIEGSLRHLKRQAVPHLPAPKKDDPILKAHIKEVLNYYTEVTNRKRNSKESVEHVSARLKEGYTVDDLCTVIDYKWRKWGSDPKMTNYVRPKTLFSEAFPDYLAEAGGDVKTAPAPSMYRDWRND